MIPRYSRPQMVDIWSPATKFRIWYEIEAHACDAQAWASISYPVTYTHLMLPTNYSLEIHVAAVYSINTAIP